MHLIGNQWKKAIRLQQNIVINRIRTDNYVSVANRFTVSINLWYAIANVYVKSSCPRLRFTISYHAQYSLNFSSDSKW